MSEQLKICPFCGGKAQIYHLISGDQLLYWPRCENCDAEINALFDTIAEAISAWNRRADQ